MIKGKKGRLEQVYWIVGIIVGFIVIVGVLSPIWIKILDKITDTPPFDIIITPDYINEGQYDKFDFKFTLNIDPNRNITSLKLTESNVIVDRQGKNSQTKVSNNILWEKTSNRGEYIFYKESYYSSSKLEAEGSLWGCNNCFMVEEFPYKFTFTFIYSEDGGEEKPLILEKIIPII